MVSYVLQDLDFVVIVVLLVILAFRSGRQWCRYLPQTSVSPLRRTHRLCVELDSARYADERILENAVENSSLITNSALKWTNICAERERESFSCAVRLSFVSLSLSEKLPSSSFVLRWRRKYKKKMWMWACWRFSETHISDCSLLLLFLTASSLFFLRETLLSRRVASASSALFVV